MLSDLINDLVDAIMKDDVIKHQKALNNLKKVGVDYHTALTLAYEMINKEQKQ